MCEKLRAVFLNGKSGEKENNRKKNRKELYEYFESKLL